MSSTPHSNSDDTLYRHRFLPNTLFGRALLILIVPIIMIQLVAIYIFYERHWGSVVRNMSSTLAGEVIVLIDAFQNTPENERLPYTQAIGRMLGITVSFDESEDVVFVEGEGRETYPDFFKDLSTHLSHPFMVQLKGEEDEIVISILMNDGTLRLAMTKKRLINSTTYIFILWVSGASVVMMVIATLFLRNQIRPIRQLAAASEQFGLGHDTPDFKPRGAAEVRQAGRAFMTMRDRIARQVATRTEMLAGISHDLRTPLTRIKLQLAMSGFQEKARKALEADVAEMEHMIQEYLDFARGVGGEQSETVPVQPYLQYIVDSYAHHDEPVSFSGCGEVTMLIRPKSMRRAIQNIIDNALRYGGKADIRVEQTPAEIWLHFEDAGPGIPEDQMEQVFRPFTRLERSRNVATGGAGLGLSIARDIVVAHGGSVTLANMKKGLRVTIKLPLPSTEED